MNFDAYTLQARIAPAVLAAAPAITLIVAVGLTADLTGKIAFFGLGCFGIVVSILVREAGKKREPSSWSSWGGNPAACRLRWRSGGDERVVSQLHDDLQPILARPLPTRAQEATDPVAADLDYERAITILRERTRDHARFPLVFAENIDYGFRRNCLGLRRVALVSGAAGIALGVAGLVAWSGTGQWLALTLVSAVMFLFWLVFVTPAWVRRAAETYADRLLESIHTLRVE